MQCLVFESVCPSPHAFENSQLLKHSFCCEILYIHMSNVNPLFSALYLLYLSDAELFLCVIIITTTNNAIKSSTGG